MTLKTNLNIAPYYQDYDAAKDYYQILFQPGVSVQTRELNILQAMFQKQIERFGENIFASGTIVSGCNFSFQNPYAYVKIKDLTLEGKNAVPYSYVNYNIMNETTGLIGWVTSYIDGFESTDPDLKTLYLRYQNTGKVSVNTVSFSAGDVLKVYDPVMNGIEAVNIINGGIGFSNSDQILAISSLVVTVTSGSIAPGDYITNNQGANVQVQVVDANTYASANQLILQVRPRNQDLRDANLNANAWTINLEQSITNAANTMAARVNQVIGAGFQGGIVTDGVGTIKIVNIINKGANYTTNVQPYITVRSLNNTTGYNTLNLTAKNYLTKLIVASTPSSVGAGYAFTITEGVVYQKGYFLRVVPQQIIVSKYDQNPDNVAVGFITNEQIVNYNMDTTLRDNVQGYENEQAPGADRLRLIPVLMKTTSAEAAANAEFLTIVEWKEGRPYKQNQSTIYSTIGDTMALRTNEVSGDFVIDPFLVTTRSPLVADDEGGKFNIVIDPGKAYIDGYRVSTISNYNVDDRKGTDTIIANNHVVSLNYGNYIILNNVAGTFQFNTGDTVDLYSTGRGFLNSPALIRAQTLLPTGVKIGTANMRSMMVLNNQPGTAGATYKLYLFNIQMLPQRNFRDVKGVYYNGALKGVADVVVVSDPTTGANIAQLYDTGSNRLTFDLGVETLMNANDVSYMYRTIDQNVTVSNGNISNATLIKDVSANPDEVWPYTGNLTSAQMAELIVIPNGAECVAVTAAAGNVSGSNTTANVVGTATTFLSDFAVGDWVYVSANSTGGGDLHQVRTIVNNTFLTVDSNNSFVNVNAKMYRTFPQNVPIPFGSRSDLTAKVDVSQHVLTLDFGRPFTFAGSKTVSLAYNIQRTAPAQTTKTPVRNRFIKIDCSSNAGNTVGPWCIGVPDVFRLRGVYIGNSTVSNTAANQIKNFYIDHNQNSNFYDLSWLCLQAQASVTPASTDFILVQFDYFTASGVGFYDTVSYTHSSNLAQILVQDSQPLSNLTTVAHSFEIPELFTDQGVEIDLMNQVDFRPQVANTVTPSTTSAAAPTNPSGVFALSLTGEKKFPVPDSLFIADIEYYIGRNDSVFVDKHSGFSVVEGPASLYKDRQIRPTTPDNSLKIIDLVIPPYPNLPTYYSTTLDEIINTNVMNQKFLTTRITNKTIHAPLANNVLRYNQPRVYTQYDIGKLDRRLHDVEYIAQLTALEAGLSQQFIPSSVDPTLDRFKFGFFVDDFVSSGFSDLTNPQYWALKEGEDIVPPKMTWDVTLPGGGPAWIDAHLVDQLLATVGSVDDPLGLGPICALNLANTVAYNTIFRNATDVLKSANPSSVVDTVNLVFAGDATVYDTVNYLDMPLTQWLQTHSYDAYKNLQFHFAPFAFGGGDLAVQSGSLADLYAQVANFAAGILTIGDTSQSIVLDGAHIGASGQSLYEFIAGVLAGYNVSTPYGKPSGGQFARQIYYPPVVLYFYNYDRPALIQIYQNGSLIKDSTTAAVLTQEDINLVTGPGAQRWFDDDTEHFLKDFNNTGGGYVTYAGKLTFNYNPAAGSNFTFKVTSPTSFRWRYVLAYPIDGRSIGCVPPTNIYNVAPTFEAQYQNMALTAWCGNGGKLGDGSATILSGFTEVWQPFSIPAPTTSVIPFSIAANWH